MADFIARVLADPTVSAAITVGVACLIALWLLSAMWVHADAAHRTGSEGAAMLAAGWVLLSTPLMLPFSLVAYAFVRPAEPDAERRLREITTAMVVDSLAAASCGACGSVVDVAWRRCPSCATWLAAPCADCGRWSDANLGVCPWCGALEREQPTVAEPATAPADTFLGLPGESAPAPVLIPALAPPHHASLDARSHGAAVSPGATPRDRRPRRLWQRRAPSAAARSLGRDTGGRTGARSRS